MLKLAVFFVICCVLVQGGSTLECWTCSAACDVSDALLNTACGAQAPASLDAFCTTEYMISEDANKATIPRIRKCVLAVKDAQPQCPSGRSCTFCNSDKCNDNSDAASKVTNNDNPILRPPGNVNVTVTVQNDNNRRVVANVATAMSVHCFSFASAILSYVSIKCILC